MSGNSKNITLLDNNFTGENTFQQLNAKQVFTAFYARGVAHGSIADSHNVSSITLNGADNKYRINFDTPMDNTDYGILSFSARDNSNLGSVARVEEKTVNYVELWVSSTDFEHFTVGILGGKD